MKPFTNQIKEQIEKYRKNRIDISDSIRDVDINNQNLSGCILSNINYNNQTIRDVNFFGATMGQEGKASIWTNCKFYNCNFDSIKILGVMFFRRNYVEDCNFSNAWLPYWEYQYSKFIRCKFCEAFIRLGGDYGLGADFDEHLFWELSKKWNVKVVKNKEE